MTRKNFPLVGLPLILLLVACNPQLPAKTPTIAAPTTQTLAPPMLPPATPSATPQANLTVRCLDILPAIPSEGRFHGTIAIAGYFTSPRAFLLDLASNTTVDLPRGGRRDSPVDAVVAPSKKEFAYHLGIPSKSQLFIVSADGSVVARRSVAGLYQLTAWNNQGEILYARFAQSQRSSLLAYPLTTVALSPETWEERELLPSYPGILEPMARFPISWEEFASTEAVFDPDMRMVVYPTRSGITLWDLQEARPLVSILAHPFAEGSPRWSPDGHSFAASLPAPGTWTSTEPPSASPPPEELFVISTTGEIRQLTTLSDALAHVEIGPMSWSPDGRAIAFWMRTNPDSAPPITDEDYPPYRLAVLDTYKESVTLYCIPAVFTDDSLGGSIFIPPHAPVWSPNSYQLLIEAADDSAGGSLVLVDPESGLAARVTDDAWAMAWLP